LKKLALLALLIASIATPVYAIDFTTVLVDLAGKPIVIEEGPMTLGAAAAAALVGQYKDDNPAGQDKVKRWALAMRVHNAKDIELTADDVKLIKDMVAKAYGPLIVGQVWAIVDPASAK
jgi:hypothetical protein